MKTAHNTFKYFVTCDSEGGYEQRTGRSVEAFSSLRAVVERVKEPIEYALGENARGAIAAIKAFKPKSERRPTTLYAFALENGGDESDWLRQDYRIVYTNVWGENISYEV